MKKLILFAGIIMFLFSCNKNAAYYHAVNATQEIIQIVFIYNDSSSSGTQLNPQSQVMGLDFFDYDKYETVHIIYKDKTYVENSKVNSILDKQSYKLVNITDKGNYYQFDITEDYILSLPEVEE